MNSEKLYYRFNTKIPKEYIYKNSSGKVVSDQVLLDYFKKLVIPPAYTNVVIYYNQNSLPKILYKGIDSKGRIQVIYSKEWEMVRNKNKYSNLIVFSKQFPKIIKSINNFIHLTSKAKNVPNQLKNIGIILSIILHCNFRIGNPKYEKLYNSYGVVNLKKKHLSLKGNGIVSINFQGKKGVNNYCEKRFEDAIYESLQRKLQRLNDEDYLFNITDPKIVNNTLKKIHPLLTSKMFRTYTANLLLIQFLKNKDSETFQKRKKNLIEALKFISNEINNTPSIAKKSYINEDLINLYLNDYKNYSKFFINSAKSSRIQFINFLESKFN